MELMEVLAVVAIPTVSGAVAWGQLRQQVSTQAKEIDGKASKDVVDTKFDAVLERLDRIDRGIERLSTTQPRAE